jgi:hypothetical protein
MIQRIADGVFAIVGAAGLSQFPEFFRQYVQRLGGRFDQAAVQEERIVAAAREHGLATQDYVQRLLANADTVAQSEGRNVLAALTDAERLRTAYQALVGANPLERPVVWVRHLDDSVARATLDQFVPAIPLSVEAFVYAGIGMLTGLIILSGLERGSRLFTIRRRPRRRPTWPPM